MAKKPLSGYGIEAAWGSIGGLLSVATPVRDLGAGSQTGSVSAKYWLSRPGQFPQNEH